MILFFYGPNTYASFQKVDDLKLRFIKKTGSDFGLEIINVDTLSENAFERIISSITSVPFLAEHRLVIIKDILSNQHLAEKILQNIKRIPESTVVVFHQVKVDERTKIFKEYLKNTENTKFMLLSQEKLITWIINKTKLLGGSISHENARHLIARVGMDQSRLINEITKLVGFENTISISGINMLTESSFEETIFDLIDSLSKGNLQESLDLYDGLRNGKLQPLYILTMLGWHIRILSILKLAEIEANQNVLKKFNISPYVANKLNYVVKQVDFFNIRKSYSRIQQTDLLLKSANPGADIIMRKLIIDIADFLSTKKLIV